MSAYYIERNNMSGNGGMNQPSQGAPGGQRAPGQPGMPAPGMGGMQADRAGNGMTGQPGMQSAPATPGTDTRDYRDDLRDLLDRAHAERGLTRYRLCKQMGIDSGTLSNVLAKRRHFSLEKLEQILGLLGYKLSFTPDRASGNGQSGMTGSSNGGMQSGMNGSNGMSGARPI